MKDKGPEQKGNVEATKYYKRSKNYNSNTRNREVGEELLNFLGSVVNQMCSQLPLFPYISGTVSSLTEYNTRNEDLKDNNVFIKYLRTKGNLLYLKTHFVPLSKHNPSQLKILFNTV
jgi:hypothetical protein